MIDPEWLPRFVAVDVDGTIVSTSGSVSTRVRDALVSAAVGGAVVVLATGRSVAELSPVTAQLRLRDGFAVCSNGAVTVELPGGQELDRVTFDPRLLVAQILTLAPRARIAVEQVRGGYGVTAPFPAGELLARQQVCALEDMLVEPVTRIVVRDPGMPPSDFRRMAVTLGLAEVCYCVGSRVWLDLVAPGVDKAWALIGLAARLGIAREDCLALGDGRNDLSMITWAGRGVAMGQATKDVREAADAVTGPVTVDGVATELERWFNRRSTAAGTSVDTTAILSPPSMSD
ncbi:HAD family hydrolase [Amycolatopsis sp. cmx-11-51]|uniref:HAD family hydrolase n=1 Tax=Amycolatopsis sp. cmx-11-51 TaxID=2785797 RepID=UPI0039E2C2D2